MTALAVTRPAPLVDGIDCWMRKETVALDSFYAKLAGSTGRRRER